MKFRTIALLLCLTPLAIADEIVLKDGTVYKDCVVERETDKDVTIIVPVGKTIKDSRTISKDKIKSITKSKADERDFAEIERKYSDIEDMDLDALKKGLALCEKFIEDHKTSNSLEKVQAIADSLRTAIEEQEPEGEEEGEEGDDKKTEISPEEFKRHGYDLEADALLAKFQERVKQNKVAPAMVVFDELSQNYGASQAYANARGTAEKVLPRLVATLEQMAKAADKKEQAVRKQESEKTMEFTRKKNTPGITVEQRNAIMDAEKKWRGELEVKREMTNQRKIQFRNKLKSIREKGLKWYNPIADIPESIRELERIAKADLERIKQEVKYPDSDKAGKGSTNLKLAWQHLDAGKLDEASEAFSELRSLRVPKQYWETFETELKAAKAAASEKARQERAAERAKQQEERRKQQEERNKDRQKGKETKKEDGQKDGDEKPAVDKAAA